MAANLCKIITRYTSRPNSLTTARHGDSFSQLDEKKHSFRRKMINHIFRMPSILESEAYIDNVTQAFLERMSEFADSRAVVNMGEWLQLSVPLPL
jgi:hypothetical protein